MPSFSSVDWTDDGLGNPVKMHAHEELITGVLKDQHGLRRASSSPTGGPSTRSPATTATQVRLSVNAGIDMFMEPFSSGQPGRLREFITTLIALVEAGEVPMSRIDDAVSRILTAKFELGLFEKPFTDRRNVDTDRQPAHRAVAREAVAESQVLLKNRQRTLPLSPRRNAAGVRRRQQRRQHRQPGRRLDAHLAGRLQQRMPGDTDPGRHPRHADGRRRRSARTRRRRCRAAPPASSSSARRRTPRASATSAARTGPTTRATTACCGRRRRWSSATPTRRRSGRSARRGHDLHGPGRVRAADDYRRPSCSAQIDALVAVLAAGQRGRWRGRRAVRPRPFTGKLPVTWPRTVAQEPINIGDARLRPALPVRLGAAHP